MTQLGIWLMIMGGAVIGAAVALLMLIGSVCFDKEKATRITNIAINLFLGSGLVLLIGLGIFYFNPTHFTL
ncbi:MAG: hypothetical protein KGV56_01630 [Gammaproteobacteria bacterium]|nr:hypothetical protein [Gammaproteobacteria bacterium]